jgi:SpoIIAA-like
MIEILAGFPDNVVAAAARGVVTRSDYQQILVPRVEQALARHRKVRFYYELGREFSGMEGGAMWEDFKVGMEHITRWERIAVVSDVEWIRHGVNAFRFLMPGNIRVFPTSEAAGARDWIAAA